jgi:iron complex transport system permease protein
LIGVSVGELSIPLQNVFYAISNKMGLTEVPLNRIYESVIWDFRLSRALVAACCGAGFAICGAVLQSLLKNALAEPYVLGVSAGASTGAVRLSCWASVPARFLCPRAPLPGRLPPSPLSPS